tara:strand:- start:3361 stop:3570 length:210 start_codon:yes stop_codon:yes gene_type:complete
METVKISPKYQIIIPARIRKKLNLKPGQKVTIQEEDTGLRISPVPTIEQMRGIAKGVDLSGFREKEDRF